MTKPIPIKATRKKSATTTPAAPASIVPPSMLPVTMFESMPAAARVRARTVCMLLGTSRATYFRRVAEGAIPKPTKQGAVATHSVQQARNLLAGMQG